MNLKEEACRNCADQCRFERRSVEVITVLTAAKEAGSLPKNKARERVSTMLLEARQKGCPQSEITRLRQGTLGQVDPASARRPEIVINPRREEEIISVYFSEKRKGTRNHL